MLSRRMMITALPAMTTLSGAVHAQGVPEVLGENVEIVEFESPGIEELTASQPFGVKPPSAERIAKAQAAIDGTPSGPTPIDILLSLITRYANDPEVISQLARSDEWNPLIVKFFDATSLKVNNDMVDWCAACANWALERNNKPNTNSAASQSFITSGKFAKVANPRNGDLAVFTCYDNANGNSLGIGHVGFFKEAAGDDRIVLVGGNQSGNGRSSIISEKIYSLKPSATTRTIGGNKVPCTFKFNQFLRV